MNRKQSLVVVLAAIGCGTEPPATDAPDPTAAPFTTAQARFAGNALAAGLEDAAGWYGPIAKTSVVATCVTTSGDATDADGDAIPANAVLTLDCSKRRLGFTGSLTGTESVVDTQPAAIAWAFTADAALQASLTGPFGGTAVTDTTGSIVGSQASALGPYLLTSTLDVATVITNVSEQQTEITEALDATVRFAPTIGWTPGGPVVAGALTVDGSWGVGVGAAFGDAVLSTPTPLVLTPSCETLITSGAVEARFALGARAASITVRWTSCGQHRVSYDPNA